MIDDPARRGDLPEGLSFMTFLPARRLVRWLAQTLDPRRLFQPVTRRRLAAIRAVQSEPALKFSDMRFQSRDLGRLRRDQRNQLFPRWLGWRSRIHRILESNPDSDVQKNLRARLRQTAYPTWAETKTSAMRSCACPTCTLNCPRQVSHLTLARGDHAPAWRAPAGGPARLRDGFRRSANRHDRRRFSCGSTWPTRF